MKRLLFMLMLSSRCFWLLAPTRSILSEPARSTSVSFEEVLRRPSASKTSRFTAKIAWDREEFELIFVEEKLSLRVQAS